MRLLADATSNGRIEHVDRSESTVTNENRDEYEDDDDGKKIRDPLQLECLGTLGNLRRLHFEVPVGIRLGEQFVLWSWS